jgi:hypothetical protein
MNIPTDVYNFRTNQFGQSVNSNDIHDLFKLDSSSVKFNGDSLKKQMEAASVMPANPVLAKSGFASQPYDMDETSIQSDKLNMLTDNMNMLYNTYSADMTNLITQCDSKFTYFSYEKYVNMFLFFLLFVLMIFTHSKMTYINKLLKLQLSMQNSSSSQIRFE